MFPHSLGFFPLFEYSISLISGTLASPDQSYQDIRATKDGLYMYPYFNYNYGQSAVTVRLNYRIYNLDIEKTYDSKSATFASAPTDGSSIGAKFLDGSTSNAVQDDSTLGFSLDTSKKTIAVHMITQQSLNSCGFNYVYHNSGYPPSYLMCDLPEQKFKKYFAGYNIPYRDRYTSSAIYNLTAYTIANGDYIAFHGVQSVVRGDFCFVILKDPLDIAE